MAELIERHEVENHFGRLPGSGSIEHYIFCPKCGDKLIDRSAGDYGTILQYCKPINVIVLIHITVYFTLV